MPWGPGPYNINTEFEIGHFEPCTRVTGRSTLTDGSFTDTFFNRCHGPYEADAPADKRSSLEPNDSPCYRRGDTHGGVADPNQVTGCDVFFGAVGDLDYDGTSYRADWPTSLHPNLYPSPFLQETPTSRGSAFTDMQFVTDTSATEAGCDVVSGTGCVLPPNGPGSLLPVLDAGPRRREVRVGVRQHAQRQHVRARPPVGPRRAEHPGGVHQPDPAGAGLRMT